MRPRSRRLTPATLLCIGISIGIVGCYRASAPVAPVEIVVASVDAGPEIAHATELPDAAVPRCTLALTAGPIRTEPGCALDERISAAPGELTFPCRGDGDATAVFDDHTFTGAVVSGQLSLLLHTELDWEDGCHWETRQSIVGELDREGPEPVAELSWTYAESAASGTDCSGACRATARVSIAEDREEASPED